MINNAANIKPMQKTTPNTHTGCMIVVVVVVVVSVSVTMSLVPNPVVVSYFAEKNYYTETIIQICKQYFFKVMPDGAFNYTCKLINRF